MKKWDCGLLKTTGTKDNDEKFHKTIGNRNAVRVCDPFYLPGVSS